MLFSRLADQKIREALGAGKFDNLPNAGRPLDLEDYFKVPEELRAAYALLKSASMLPEEAEWRLEIDRLERALSEEPSAERRQTLRREIDQLQLRLAVATERARQRR